MARKTLTRAELRGQRTEVRSQTAAGGRSTPHPRRSSAVPSPVRRPRLKLDELEPRIAPSSLLYNLALLGGLLDAVAPSQEGRAPYLGRGEDSADGPWPIAHDSDAPPSAENFVPVVPSEFAAPPHPRGVAAEAQSPELRQPQADQDQDSDVLDVDTVFTLLGDEADADVQAESLYSFAFVPSHGDNAPEPTADSHSLTDSPAHSLTRPLAHPSTTNLEPSAVHLPQHLPPTTNHLSEASAEPFIVAEGPQPVRPRQIIFRSLPAEALNDPIPQLVAARDATHASAPTTDNPTPSTEPSSIENSDPTTKKPASSTRQLRTEHSLLTIASLDHADGSVIEESIASPQRSSVSDLAATEGLGLCSVAKGPTNPERVSVASDGTEANKYSYDPRITPDGRYVAFRSAATNLVPGDFGSWDIFVYDRSTHTTERVSVAPNGTQANGCSSCPAISADGRFVAFDSNASNLVPDDINDTGDVFVFERHSDVMERVSVASDGTQGNGDSHRPSISADGRFVAFLSEASNLVPDDTNDVRDVFVFDRLTRAVERVSVAWDGTQGKGSYWEPSISADGRFVAFTSTASDLVPGDTNNFWDAFVYDRQTHTVERVSVGSDGSQHNTIACSTPSISADGRYVAFDSYSQGFVPGDTNQNCDVFVYDRLARRVQRVSVASDGTQGNGRSTDPCISPDGRYVAFYSEASNLVPGDTNGVTEVFVYDRNTETLRRVDVASDGMEANGSSGFLSGRISISEDGVSVAFDSDASNLVPGDTNGFCDVFVYNRHPTPAHPCVTGLVPAPEGRMAAVSSVVAYFSHAVVGVTETTFKVARDRGTDRLWGTSDDICVPSAVAYDLGSHMATLTPSSPLTAYGEYGVWLDDSIMDADGNALDGEYPGARPGLPSGDGVPGGDFVATFTLARIIPDVPACLWRHGCGPTAAGMVLGYWDGHGYPNYVVGDATTQTSNVNGMIASDEHYSDYSLPLDSATGILDDRSTLGGAHSNNCIADWMHTSWSAEHKYYGSSVFGRTDDAMDAYADWVGYPGAISKNESWGEFTWGDFMSEMEAGRPMVFLVDSDGDAISDHAVTAIGYDTVHHEYACYNTWDTSVHWYEFAEVASGRSWGIDGATFFNPGPPTLVSSAPSGLDLLAVSDTGVDETDNITNLDNSAPGKILQFEVFGTVTGARVALYIGATEIGSGWAAGATTVVSTNGTLGLTNSAHPIVARQTEPGKLESFDSPLLTLTVDAVPPRSPNPPDLDVACDSGPSNTDNITNDNTPALNLSGFGTYYRLYRNGTQVSGDYEDVTPYVDEPLADGSHAYTLRAVDAAGNASPASAALNVRIDTAGPKVTALAPAPGAAVGALTSLVATFNEDLAASSVTANTFKLSRDAGTDALWGTGDDTYVAGAVAYSATTDRATFTPGVALTDGQYRVWLDGTASVSDLAGNALDGEYVDVFPSGDDVAGGDFVSTFEMAFILGAGGVPSREYTDADGDRFRLAFSGAGRAQVRFQPATEIGADIHAITFTGARSVTRLTCTLVQPSPAGAGRTTIQTIDAPGQALGTLDFSLRQRGVAALNQSSILGDVTIGGALTKLVVGGDLGGHAQITGKATTFDVRGDVLAVVQISGNGTTFKVAGDVLGDVDIRGKAGTVTIGGELDAEFTARDTITKLVAGSLGEDARVRSEQGSITTLTTTGDLNGEVTAAVSLVKVTSGGGLGATLDAGLDIGSVFAADGITSNGLTSGRDIKKVQTDGGLEADLAAGRNVGTVMAEALTGDILAVRNITKVQVGTVEGSQIVAGTGGSTTADIGTVQVGAGGILNAQIRAGDQITKVTTTAGTLEATIIVAGVQPGPDGQYGMHPNAAGQATDNVVTNARAKVAKVEAVQYLDDVRILSGGARLGTYTFGGRAVTTSEATPNATLGPDFLTLVRTVNGVSTVV